MAKTRDWSGLGEAQRNRYIIAGRTGTLTGRKGLTAAQVRKYYESGKDLSGGRGHAGERVAREVKPLALRAAIGADTTQDRKLLSDFRRSRQLPAWLPKDKSKMSDSTAASLAIIGTAPRNWKNVQVTYNDDTKSYSVLVTTKRGAKRTTELDREGLREFGRLMKNPTSLGKTKAEQKSLKNQWTRTNGAPWDFKVNIEIPTDSQ